MIVWEVVGVMILHLVEAGGEAGSCSFLRLVCMICRLMDGSRRHQAELLVGASVAAMSAKNIAVMLQYWRRKKGKGS